jgi:ABC-2 type transport system permease protein
MQSEHSMDAQNNNSIVRPIPSYQAVLKALFRADLRTQWRQRRAVIMSLLVPIIFVISWKSLIPEIGAAGVLSICIAIGLPAIGLMSYSQTVARDRERGVFQRLRAAPIPTSAIMISRIAVQLVVVLFMAIATYAFGNAVDGIHLPLLNILLLLIAALVGGLSFLGLGQFVVGSIKSSEGVNAAARLIYFPLAIIGALGQIGLFGKVVETIVTYSPIGTTKTLLAAAMDVHAIGLSTLWALLITLGYGIFFAAIGIKRFTWAIN